MVVNRKTHSVLLASPMPGGLRRSSGLASPKLRGRAAAAARHHRQGARADSTAWLPGWTRARPAFSLMPGRLRRPSGLAPIGAEPAPPPRASPIAKEPEPIQRPGSRDKRACCDLPCVDHAASVAFRLECICRFEPLLHFSCFQMASASSRSDYQLGCCVGKGAFGVVHTAVYLPTGEIRAAKIAKPGKEDSFCADGKR